jgi:hypothetical protein
MNSQRKKKVTSTPVRTALKPMSSLRALVRNGLGAVKGAHRSYIDASIRPEFADSIDIDTALQAGHDQENRWDYLLGHTTSGKVIALEPHSAKQDQVSTVIRKRDSAREQLRPHLNADARISSWLWVASGRVHFADTETVRRRLDQHGILFVGPRLLRKHLPT